MRRFAPVKVGDEIDVKIEAVGEKGDGIAKVEGFVLIVPNTKKDDEVKVRVTKLLRRVGFAEVVGKGSAPSEEDQEEGIEDAEEEPEEASEEEEYQEDAEEESEEEDTQEDSEDFGEDLEE